MVHASGPASSPRWLYGHMIRERRDAARAHLCRHSLVSSFMLRVRCGLRERQRRGRGYGGARGVGDRRSVPHSCCG